MSASAPRPGRVYGGRSEAERRADRRERLVEAGLDLFGTLGWSATTIEKLCSTAGVATRAFYEEFPDRSALLVAVYDRVLSDAAGAVVDAVSRAADDLGSRTRAGITAYVTHLTDDPRRARVVNKEARVADVTAVQQHRQEALTRFVDLVGHEVRVRRGSDDLQRQRVLALALTGAVNEVLADWVSSPVPRPPVGPVVETLAELYVAALAPPAAAGAPAPQGPASAGGMDGAAAR